jgi:hypothetical protein
LRSEPLFIAAQVASLPLGKFMAATLPTRPVRLPFTKWEFSLNPGPFNRKEHVLIIIFANAGTAFGNGSAYAVGIITIIKAFYKRKIGFFASLMVVITTQVGILIIFIIIIFIFLFRCFQVRVSISFQFCDINNLANFSND